MWADKEGGRYMVGKIVYKPGISLPSCYFLSQESAVHDWPLSSGLNYLAFRDLLILILISPFSIPE